MVTDIWQKKSRWLLYAVVAVGVLASLLVCAQRMALEAENRATLLSLEWGQLKDVAARNGYTAEEALEYFAAADDDDLFSGVVYKEPTLADWQNSGYLQLATGTALLNDMRMGGWQAEDNWLPDNQRNFIVLYDADMQQRVFEHLQNKTSAQNILHKLTSAEDEIFVVETTYPYTDLTAFGIGFNEDELALLQKHGLDLVVQVRSFPKVDEQSLDFVFGSMSELGTLAVLFNDTELPGVTQNNWAEISKYMAGVLQAQNLPTGYVEFYKQTGLQTFTRDMDYQMVRLHPVSEAELLKLTDTRVEERFALAAGERSMGVMMLRLRPSQSLDDAVQYIGAVRDAIQQKGVETDRLTVVPDMQVPKWSLAAALAAVWAGGVLLLRRFDLVKAAWLLPTAGLLAGVGLLVIGQEYWLQKLVALSAAVIFPFLGVAAVAREDGRSLPKAVLAFGRMTLISLVGAVLIIGTLSEKSYMSTMNTFSGVKVGQLLPLLLLMIYLLYRLASDHGGLSYLLVSCWRVMKMKVTVGMVLLAGIAAGMLLFYMLRTGNSGVGISEAERAFRAFLDNVLMVRPRTKEFMIAHPIMLAVLYFGYRRNLWPLALLGAIGQVSLVNTFEHLHTPVLVSLIRTVNGWWLGVLIGLVLVLLLKYVGGWLLQKVQSVARLAEDEAYGS